MVVSKSPIVLGNEPPLSQRNNYEKIAFIGQVPVKTYGKVNIGDYIIRTNNNDGVAIAKSPNQIQINEYSKIVGIAWAESIFKNSKTLKDIF